MANIKISNNKSVGKTWVVKIGSALLTNNGKGLDKSFIAQWIEQIVLLKQQGVDIILVSSGAIAEGMQRLGWRQKPKDIHQLQAAAAVGQMGLIQTYESLFAKYDIHTAHILLTHDNLTNVKRYQNISSTLDNLLNLNTVPIINENDTVATDEIKFGDNDTLAALVANLVNAQCLVILTDQNGIFSSDPRVDPEARIIDKIHINDKRLKKVAGKTSGTFGSGGMYSKVMAAKQAQKSNTYTYIISGRQTNALMRLYQGEHVGTLIYD